MAMSLRIAAILAIVPVIHGAFTCSEGFKDKAGTPICAGAVSSTCSRATCCDVGPTCSDFSATWVLKQVVGGGCVADTKFFDLKKLGVEVAAPKGDAEVKAACCTAFADAKCSDWNAKSCPLGKSLVSSNAAPADGSNGKTLSQDKYEEMCCVVPPKTCSDFSTAWVLAQLLGQGCFSDSAKKFFDLKKVAVDVAAPANDAEVKEACCTAFADAKCSDWNAKSCPLGKSLVSPNAAPADGSNGKTLSQDKYEEMCCVVPPKTCSDFTTAWVGAQLLGRGCFSDGAKKFFDLKKVAVDVAAPANDAEVKEACCTAFADAKCSDWNLKVCPSGKFLVATASAPADGGDGKTLSQDKYNELCCREPMECADYAEEISSATSFSFAALAVLLSIYGF